MKIFEKLRGSSYLLLPILALFSSFKLYGLIGFFLILSYIIIIFISTGFYFQRKQKNIFPKNHEDDKLFEEYLQQSNQLEMLQIKTIYFTWLIPFSLMITLYLYLQVEYGILFILLFIIYFLYEIKLHQEVIEYKQHMKKHIHRTKDGNTMDELQGDIKLLQERIDELYELTGFDASKIDEVKSKKKRVSIINKLWDIDFEYNWLENLFHWADLNNVSTYDIPRNKQDLLEQISYGTISSLYLENMNIDSIPSEIGYIHTYTDLNFSLNNLTTIPVELTNISHLETLNFRLNDISSIPSQFEKLKNLRSLDLSSNKLISIPSEITTLTNLNELLLHNNPIKNLPNEISKMKSLKKITIDSNVEISEDIRNSLGNKLVIIEIGWMQGLWDWAELNKLDENILPRNKTELLKIDSIKISPLDLSYILSTSQNSSGDLHINIDKNSYITKLPREIGYLTNLKELFINHTKITNLPKEIGNLINLEVLNLDNTNINKLPPEIGNLRNLKKLLIRNTKITTLPIEMYNLKTTEILMFDRYH